MRNNPCAQLALKFEFQCLFCHVFPATLTNNSSSGLSTNRSPYRHPTYSSGNEVCMVVPWDFQGWRPIKFYSEFCDISVHLSPPMSSSDVTSKTISLTQIVIEVGNCLLSTEKILLHLTPGEKPGFLLARIWRVWKHRMLHPDESLLIHLTHADLLGGKEVDYVKNHTPL